MSSLNDYIRFALDIEDHNIVFKDYFYKILNGTKYKIYEAELIQPACPFCGSVSLIHNGHLKIYVRYITANACASSASTYQTFSDADCKIKLNTLEK